MIETSHLTIKGMHCAACTVRIEKVISKIEGVVSVTVNLATEKGRVTYNSNIIPLSEILNKVNKMGFKANEIQDHSGLSQSSSQAEVKRLHWNFVASAILTIPLAWAMIAHFQWASLLYVPSLFHSPLFQLAITIPIQFVIGLPFYERAFAALRDRSANMDVLVVLSTSAAFFYSHYLTMISLKQNVPLRSDELFYETSAFIITFILLGKLLEAKTKGKTTEALRKLYELQTETATLFANGKQQVIKVERLKRGDVILLEPGGRVPIDGQVISGYSMIDESLLTGESAPIEKKLGGHVYAGTINQHGHLLIKVKKTETETTLSHIIRIVEEAQAGKAPIQQIADKMTSVFVPVVIILALATFLFWYMLLEPGNGYLALERLITVLIIACPCALGLATPTSVMVGSGRAAQMGILFKEGKYLELLGRSSAAIIDKTGTITKGEPVVTDLYVEEGSQQSFLELVGAVEQVSGHPIGKAVLTLVERNLLHLPMAKEVKAMPGYGIRGIVGDKQVILANPRFYQKNKRSLPPRIRKLTETLEREGKTVVIAAIDSRFAGVIATEDEIKPTSKAAIKALQQRGIDVIMLTGDNKTIAQTVAKKTGIHTYFGEVTPEEKALYVNKLKESGHNVMMVGDGINDAPALATADVGVAIGSGSDIAMNSGDVAIMTGNLLRLNDAIYLSKKTLLNIKQNLLWAFFYNLIMIPFAMIGILPPWLAGAVMACSSVTVVLNALRLKRVKVS